MRVGITYDLRSESGSGTTALTAVAPEPDDSQEEYDSPATIEAIAAVLCELGHDVDRLGDGRELMERLLSEPPDFVFNIAEGQGIGRAREARVPALLEMLGIPYTGSDPLTLAVTLDKDCAKRLVESAGVTVPRGVVIAPDSPERLPVTNCRRVNANRPRSMDILQSAVCKLPFPLIAKPAWEGSSKGIRSRSLVDRPEDLFEVVDSLWSDHRQPVLVEEYIEGDELTVGVIGNTPPQVVGIMRVLPRRATNRFIYSLEIKRDFERLVHYECPAQLSGPATGRVNEAALAVYRALGCRDVARIDFRLRDGIPYFLEVNPLPGLNPKSGDLVIMSGQVGWSYSKLIGTILGAAQERQREEPRLVSTAGTA